MPIPLGEVEKQSKDVDASLHQVKTIVMDVKELLTHTLVRLQKLAAQELVDREQIIDNHLLKSREKKEATKKEIEELKKENDRLMVEKEQLWDDRE